MTVDIVWTWHVTEHPPTLHIEARHTRADGVQFDLKLKLSHNHNIESACKLLRGTIEHVVMMPDAKPFLRLVKKDRT